MLGCFASHEILKRARHLRRFGAVFSFQLHRHHRRRGLADGAALSAEFYLLQCAVSTELDAEMKFPAPRLCHEVDALRRPARKDDLVRARCADVLRDARPCRFVRLRS